MVGGLIMCHGDDAGLRVPPRLAPDPGRGGAGARPTTGPATAAERLVDELEAAGVRVELDARVDVSFGRRSVDWELKGVPVRLEVGPRDLAEGVVTVVRRDAGYEGRPWAARRRRVEAARLLETIQADMLATATAGARRPHARSVTTVDEAIDAVRRRLGRHAVGGHSAPPTARPGSGTRASRCAAWWPPTAPCRPTRTSPDIVAYLGRAY